MHIFRRQVFERDDACTSRIKLEVSLQVLPDKIATVAGQAKLIRGNAGSRIAFDNNRIVRPGVAVLRDRGIQ